MKVDVSALSEVLERLVFESLHLGCPKGLGGDGWSRVLSIQRSLHLDDRKILTRNFPCRLDMLRKNEQREKREKKRLMTGGDGHHHAKKLI